MKPPSFLEGILKPVGKWKHGRVIWYEYNKINLLPDVGFNHHRAALIQTYNLKSLNLKLFRFLYCYSLCTYLVILPSRLEMGRKCRNTHCGLELSIGDLVLLAGQKSGELVEDHQVFSISPAYFTTSCFTLFQVPSSDRHQLDEAPGSNKPDLDGKVPVANEVANPSLLSSFLLMANRD